MKIIPATAKIIKPKNCRQCGEAFFPARPLQRACSVACAASLAQALREKAERLAARTVKRETKQALLRIKTRAMWLKEAQQAFNAYIRARDEHEPCISCGRHHGGQYHAGHYLSTGARPELRFTETNCHKQCQPCNTHLHGNLVLYRVALIEKVGMAEVAFLEGPHTPAKWTVDDLKAIKAEYKNALKELNHG